MSATRILRRTAAVAVAAGIAATLAACSGAPAADPTGSERTTGESFRIPESGCGSFSAPMPDDPEGAIAALGEEQQAALRGYTAFEGSSLEILPSAWADWAPDGDGPFRVGVSWGQLVSPFQTAVVEGLEQGLEKSELIDEVTVSSTSSNFDVPQQIQQYQAMVQDGVDLIILQAVSGEAFVEPVAAAAAAGIPTITLVGPVPSEYAVNVDGNNFLGSATMASFLVQQLGGAGSVLQVHALESTALDAQADAAWAAVYEECPDISTSGEIYGYFSDAEAKSQTLAFLATNPAPVDGVLEASAMTAGVMQAFQESGRPMPVIPDNGLSKGALGYWLENESTFASAGTAVPATAASGGLVEIALRMLAGQGVTINTIVDQQPIVTEENLADWADPSWTLETPGIAVGTRDDMFRSEFLDGFFTSPAPVE